MKRNMLALALLTVLGLTACVALPAQNPDDSDCTLSTHSYTLASVPLQGQMSCGGDARGCLVILMIIPAGSLVVSGSIVAVGNTVHWIERQGRCPDSATQRAATTLVTSSKAAGGYVLNSAADALRWLRSAGERHT